MAAALIRFRDYVPPHANRALVKEHQPHITIGSLCVEAERFAYFLFAPTLIFRDSYPRSPPSDIDWLAAAAHLGDFFATIAFGLLVLKSLAIPTLEASLSRGATSQLLQQQRQVLPSTLAEFFLVVYRMIAPSMCVSRRVVLVTPARHR